MASDFDPTALAADWNNVVSVGGSLTFLAQGVTASGIWNQRASMFESFEEQLRNERRYTIFTTRTQLSAVPTLRSVVTRGGVGYFVEGVRTDAEDVGVELDVKQVL